MWLAKRPEGKLSASPKKCWKVQTFKGIWSLKLSIFLYLQQTHAKLNQVGSAILYPVVYILIDAFN